MTSARARRVVFTLLAMIGILYAVGTGRADEPAAEAPGWRLVLLYPAAPPEPASAPGVTDAEVEAAEAAWLWSERCPPRRLTSGDLLHLLGAEPTDCGDRPETLTISLPGAAERPPGTLIAAPAAMWLEVPEAWLPTVAVPRRGSVTLPRWAAERWRIRYLASGLGTWPLDVPAGRSASALHPVAAGDLAVRATDAGGREGLPAAGLTIFGEGPGARPEVRSRHQADTEGLLQVPSLPPEDTATFVLGAAGHTPDVRRGRVGDLPAAWSLTPAVEVRGRFVDADGTAVGGVQVAAEGWLADDLPVSFTRKATAGQDGAWQLLDLPSRTTLLSARHDGFAAHTRRLALEEAGSVVDLGDLVLEAGAGLPVRVLDSDATPLPGALVTVEADPAPPVAADEAGLALVLGLSPGQAAELSVSAPGFLTQVVAVPLPWPDEVEVEMTQGLTVRARFVDPQGLPVVAGRVRVGAGSRFRYEELAPEGRLDLLLDPYAEWSLELTSASTRRQWVTVAPGRPGEVRDLGDVVARAGLVVYGTLVSTVDGGPVAGGRLWVPRATASGGVLVSWLHDDFVEAVSGEEGRFELTGLSPAPQRIFVEAPGFARTELEVVPEGGQTEVDAGVVELDPGARVVATIDDAGSEVEGLRASLDLRGAWNPLDMLTAPVVDDRAEFLHVPVGSARLLVSAGIDELLCEREITVEADDAEVEVACDARRDPVAGQVTVGGIPAGAGTLVWSRDGAADRQESVIYNRETRGGLRQQSVVGGGRPEVRVEVGGEGAFRTERLTSGRWSVTWRPESGSTVPPRSVEVPTGPVRDLQLAFPGHGLTGTVVDETGEPVPRAMVRELTSGAFALTAADGSFWLTGLEPGRLRLQGRDDDRYSPVTEVYLEADRPPDAVRLEVSRRHRSTVAVQVWSQGGYPGDGAFLFVQGRGQDRVHLVTAGATGEAEVTLPAPLPSHVRVAVHHEGHWSFGGWLDWDEARRGVEVQLPPSGRLEVRSEEASGPLRLVSGSGWEVSRLLARLGAPPRVSPDRPWTLDGLPAGEYLLEAEGERRPGGGVGGFRVSVAAGRHEEAVVR